MITWVSLSCSYTGQIAHPLSLLSDWNGVVSVIIVRSFSFNSTTKRCFNLGSATSINKCKSIPRISSWILLKFHFQSILSQRFPASLWPLITGLAWVTFPAKTEFWGAWRGVKRQKLGNITHKKQMSRGKKNWVTLKYFLLFCLLFVYVMTGQKIQGILKKTKKQKLLKYINHDTNIYSKAKFLKWMHIFHMNI